MFLLLVGVLRRAYETASRVRRPWIRTTMPWSAGESEAFVNRRPCEPWSLAYLPTVVETTKCPRLCPTANFDISRALNACNTTAPASAASVRTSGIWVETGRIGPFDEDDPGGNVGGGARWYSDTRVRLEDTCRSPT